MRRGGMVGHVPATSLAAPARRDHPDGRTVRLGVDRGNLGDGVCPNPGKPVSVADTSAVRGSSPHDTTALSTMTWRRPPPGTDPPLNHSIG